MRLRFAGILLTCAVIAGGSFAEMAWADTSLRPVLRPVFQPVQAQMEMALAPANIAPGTASDIAPNASLRPVLRTQFSLPELRWDNHPRGTRWSVAVMNALRSHGSRLVEVVPADIENWCPAYREGDANQRAAFWAGLVSSLAWHESTHRPEAVGGDGLWYGLTQIAPPTAEWRNCQVTTGEGLLDGPANLSCAIRIMAITVPRDGVVSSGMRGVAADWGPFHSARKREDMRRWVSGQEYCAAPLRPMMRPEGLGFEAAPAQQPTPQDA